MKVAVTGCTGFVASFLCRELLKKNYFVIGTVRSLNNENKYKHLKELENADKNLKLVEADLLGGSSQFEQAFQNCEVVFHTASPFFHVKEGQDPQKLLIEPALNGTKNVLNACLKNQDTIKKVIITSSVASVAPSGYQKKGTEYSYTEEDWNDAASLTNNPYAYSKTLAEKEAWKFLQEEKPSFDIVTINPPLITGPILASGRIAEHGTDELNTSNKIICKRVSSDKNDEAPTNRGFSIVDVRDVAKTHIMAAENPNVKNTRLITSSGRMSNAHLSQILVKHFPQFKEKIPQNYQPNVSIEEDEKEVTHFSPAKLQQLLPQFGEYISIEQSIVDTVNSLIHHKLV